MGFFHKQLPLPRPNIPAPTAKPSKETPKPRYRDDEEPEPANPAFVKAIAHLQWGWKHNTRIGTKGRYNRHAWQDLMQVVLRLNAERK
jgi:hypothetical protein